MGVARKVLIASAISTAWLLLSEFLIRVIAASRRPQLDPQLNVGVLIHGLLVGIATAVILLATVKLWRGGGKKTSLFFAGSASAVVASLLVNSVQVALGSNQLGDYLSLVFGAVLVEMMTGFWLVCGVANAAFLTFRARPRPIPGRYR